MHIAVALGAVSLVLQLLQGLPSHVQFRTEIRLVYVDVAVFDEHGGEVRDLRPADFRVLENRRKVDLEFFWRAEGPMPPHPSANAVIPFVSAVSFGNYVLPGGRALAIVLDADQIGFRPRLATRTRAIANLIIDGLGPNDFAAIVTVGGGVHQQSDFTRSKQALRRVVERFRPTASPMGNSTAERFEMAAHSLNAARALSRLVEAFQTVEDRRKGIVLISGGGSFSLAEPSRLTRNPHEAMVRSAFSELILQAKREGVPFYTFDPGEMSLPAGAGQRTLQWLSHETNGIAAVNTNTSEPEVQKVLDATAVHYVLGYYSAAPADQAFHTISVETARPHVRVRAREGFVARRRPATLATAIRSALPLTDVPVRVVTVPVPSGVRGRTGVIVSVEVEGADLSQQTDTEGLLVSTDMRGEVTSETRLWPGEACSPGPTTEESMRMCGTLLLEAGRHMVRVAVRRHHDGAIGTAFEAIDVPSLSNDFAVGGLVIVRGEIRRAATAQNPFGGAPVVKKPAF